MKKFTFLYAIIILFTSIFGLNSASELDDFILDKRLFSKTSYSNLSYRRDIQTIWNKYMCIACHHPTGEFTALDLREGKSYDALSKGGYLDVSKPTRSNLFQWVSNGEMPPNSGLKVTETDIEKIVEWMANGAENN